MPSITLSSFFDANVRLVAGVCSRCYREAEDDVKIVAVNRKFLEQIELRKNLRERRSSEDNAARAAFDRCQNDRLKLPPTSESDDGDENDNYAPIIAASPTPSNCNGERLGDSKIKLEIQSYDENRNVAKVRLGKLFDTKPKKREPLWSPPRSPHNLIEESLFRDPWSLLVATIFLNKTSCMCARPRVEEFLRDFDGPLQVLAKPPAELQRYFLDLGLFKKRAEQVWRMSYDYVHKDWTNAKQLYGIGKYGEDAYRIFVLGDLDVEPSDRFLRIYRDWARMHLGKARHADY